MTEFKKGQPVKAKKIAATITKTVKTVIAVLAIVTFIIGMTVMFTELFRWGFSIHPFVGGFALVLIGSFLFAVFNSIRENG